MPIPKAKLTKIVLDELAAVPIGAQDIQGSAILKSKQGKQPTSVTKRSALTSAELGHAHVLYCIDDSMAGTTSYESTYVEGQNRDHYTGHSHPWVRGEDGSITVGEAMGHTHTVGVMSAALAKGAENKSTQATPAHEAATTPEGTMSNTPDFAKQLADLTKRNERLERVAKMSGAQKALFDTLTNDDAEAFLAKTNAERDDLVAKAAEDDKPIWTGEVTKVSVRKRDGELALQLAKQNEAHAIDLAKAKEAGMSSMYKERVSLEIPHLAKSIDVKAAVLKAIDSIADDNVRKEAVEMLKGADSIMKDAGIAKGANPGSDPEIATDDAALRKAVEEFQKANNIATYEVAFNKAIASDPKSRDLYEQLES